jgi:hypothetical protein
MFVAAFADYCDLAVEDAAERLRGDDIGTAARLRKYIGASTKGCVGNRRGCVLAKGTAELAGRYPDVDTISAKTYKAIESEILNCERQAPSNNRRHDSRRRARSWKRSVRRGLPRLRCQLPHRVRYHSWNQFRARLAIFDPS